MEKEFWENNMRKKILVVLLALSGALIAVSCGSGEPSAPTDGDNLYPDTEADGLPDVDKVTCNYSSADSKIKPDTLSLEFSGYYKTFGGTRYLTITNRCATCTGTLEITSAELIQDENLAGFTLSPNPVAAQTVSLRKDEKVTFGVSYFVVSWEDVEGILRIHSTDKCYPQLDIPLIGRAKSSPQITVRTPDDANPDDNKMEFGEGFDEKVSPLEIHNTGSANLRVGAISITIGASAKAGEPGFFVKTSIPSDKDIVPGLYETAEIGCRNDKNFPLGLVGEAEILNNDATDYAKNQRYKVELFCGPERTDIPTAKLVCTPQEVPILTWPTLDGSQSTDVDGVTTTGLSYFWTFASVPGGGSGGGASIGDLNDKTKPVANVWSDAPKATFQAMLKGTYSVRLMVKNADNLTSNWADCDIEAIPNDELIVKMIWDNKDSDMDLHLVPPGGAYGDPATDCYFYNCSPQYTGARPDWGVVGETKDDPALDVDNTTGRGPETIYVNQPANGVYKVIVHAYDTSRGPSTAIVKVYTHAVQAASASALFTQTNTCWDVFSLTVTDGTGGKKNIAVQPLGGSVYSCDPPPVNP